MIHFTRREGQRSTRPAASPAPASLTSAPPSLPLTLPGPTGPWAACPSGGRPLLKLFPLWKARPHRPIRPILTSVEPSRISLRPHPDHLPHPHAPRPASSFLRRAHRLTAYRMDNLLVLHYLSPPKQLKALRRQKSLFLFADVS